MHVWVGPGYDLDSRNAIAKAIDEFPCDIFIRTRFVSKADVTIEPNRGQHHCGGRSIFGFDEGSPLRPLGNAGEYAKCETGPSTIITTRELQKEWPSDTSPPELRYDSNKRFVIFVHELGHAAGIDHTPQTARGTGPKSIMEPFVLNHDYRERDGVRGPALTRSQLLDLVRDYCL
jgi:hypothetical protein